MGENKAWWQSKAVYGGLVAVAAGVAGVMGYAIDQDAQNGIVELLVGIAGGIGGLWAMYGRVKATKKIK